MSDASRLLRLEELDGQLARWREQHGRDGLEAYRRRRDDVHERLQTWRARTAESQSELARCEAELAAAPQRRELQDEILNHMLLLEELEPQGPELSARLVEAEQELTEAEPEETERLESLRARLEAAERERAQLLSEIPEQLGRGYEAGRRRTGLGLVLARGGRCQACRVQLTDNDQRRLRLGEALLCQTCQAVLVSGNR